MLKLNMFFLVFIYLLELYLNTSYVKVKHNEENDDNGGENNLNTSYVKVKLNCLVSR